ncbi:MAG TPA: PEP-CTERM sorting domain-containing protein, partial [Candidatus Paceibacterota bacterium]|nr:PEP-CTERM sorting domain-containing protein [Verrucomicrobiota bacterium]HSA12957.1 PEP-CTERM sorting domain-containing protein [Candidatus Paceibacterota bacterium]
APFPTLLSGKVCFAKDSGIYTPNGISIDKNPTSPNFGKVFVSNATTGNTTAGGFARSTPEGIYVLRADGAHLGFGTGGVTWGGTLGPGKSTIGPDGHLYVTDLSNDLCYEMSSDLQSATQLIAASNKTANQYINSIVVTGTQAGGDRQIYLVNGFYSNARTGLIRYDLGANATATPSDTGTQIIGNTAWSGFYPYDVARDSNGDWYVNTYRSTINQAPPIIKFDGEGTLTLDDDKIWSASAAYAGSPRGIDIDENAGLVAYSAYDNGYVRIFDMETGAFIEEFDAGARGRELAFDAAGNLVVLDSTIEQVQFWTPGGHWVTEYDSAGIFSIIPEPTTLSLLTLGGLAFLLRRRR